MNISQKNALRSLLVFAAAAGIFIISKYVYKGFENLHSVYGISQILRLLPEFSLAIALPFAFGALLLLLPKETNCTRIFYFLIYTVIITAVTVQMVRFRTNGSGFMIFRVIAYFCGGFTDMVLYEFIIQRQFNKVDRLNK